MSVPTSSASRRDCSSSSPTSRDSCSDTANSTISDPKNSRLDGVWMPTRSATPCRSCGNTATTTVPTAMTIQIAAYFSRSRRRRSSSNTSTSAARAAMIEMIERRRSGISAGARRTMASPTATTTRSR